MKLYDDPHYPNLGVIKPKGAFIVSTKGKIYGNADYTRLNALKWYQKIWAKISWRYKLKYIDYKPFKLK